MNTAPFTKKRKLFCALIPRNAPLECLRQLESCRTMAIRRWSAPLCSRSSLAVHRNYAAVHASQTGVVRTYTSEEVEKE